MKLASTWAVLLTLAGAGSLALGQEAHRDRVQPIPPEAAVQLHRESLLRVIETGNWAATEVDADKRTLSARPLSHNAGVPVDDPLQWSLDKFAAKRPPNTHPVGSVQWILAGGFGLSLDRFPVAADAKILIDGVGGELKNLKPGMRLTLVLSKDKSSLTRVEAVTDGRAVLKSIDADKKTITVTLQGKDHVFALADSVSVYTDGEVDKEHGKVLALADLKPGARLALSLQPSTPGERPVVSIIRFGK